MKKNKAGRKPKDGIRAMSDAEKQSNYRQRKKQDVINAENNLGAAKTDALLKLILLEFNKIDNLDAGNLSIIRKVIVELCNRYSIPVEQIEFDANGLIDIDDDIADELETLRDNNKLKERIRSLISIRESEMDALNNSLESAGKDEVDGILEDKAQEAILIELLYAEFNSIS